MNTTLPSMTPVVSSNVDKVGYDMEKKELHVLFKNGSHYIYAAVPIDAYRAFLGAESVGSHFAQHIRGKFTHRRFA